jgi:SAM-dependent methyltransferase
MAVFGAYSRYYDLLYRDKDYAGEAEYLQSLIKIYHPGAKSMLDLGCGTGRHAQLLARKGYEVTGIDRSEEMLTIANAQLSSLPSQSFLNFHQGDIRSIRLNSTFDVVVSLFHVISYQTTNDDLQAVFATVQDHLQSGGIFVFDFWYGPAVLSDPPAIRIKRLEDAEIAVTRIAEPVMHANQNIVEVNYQVLVHDKASGVVESLQEQHRIRYLFRPEIALFFREVGLTIVEDMEWMSRCPLGLDTWSGCIVARKE